MQLPPPPVGYQERMPRFDEALDLRVVGQNPFGRDVLLAETAANAWIEMLSASIEDGVRLLLLSGYRSMFRQAEIVRGKLDSGMLLEAILQVNAYPGFSEHHTGRAIDFGSPDCEHFTEAFETTKEFAWLNSHAGQYGFALSYPRLNTHGIVFEPWHWRLR